MNYKYNNSKTYYNPLSNKNDFNFKYFSNQKGYDTSKGKLNNKNENINNNEINFYQNKYENNINAENNFIIDQSNYTNNFIPLSKIRSMNVKEVKAFIPKNHQMKNNDENY